MTSLAVHQDPDISAVRLASRGDLTTFLMQLAADTGADCYMLVAIPHDQDEAGARIVASNWIYDAIELAGHRLIASLAQNPLVTNPGMRPRAIRAGEAPDLRGLISGEEAKLLDVLGHGELYSLGLHIGRMRYFVILSAAAVGRIAQDTLGAAQLRCCYALSQNPGLLAGATVQDPLSDRERECLFWVSEGKTTDEVSVILGVSSNTINSYITHAIQKLAASNRAMAIATAIRSGIL